MILTQERAVSVFLPHFLEESHCAGVEAEVLCCCLCPWAPFDDALREGGSLVDCRVHINTVPYSVLVTILSNSPRLSVLAFQISNRFDLEASSILLL